MAPLQMTFVEEDSLAEMLFGKSVIPAAALLKASALPYKPYQPNEMDSRPFGVDISIYNGTMDYQMMKDYGPNKIAYATARMGMSWGYQDPKFIKHWTGLRDVGIPRMAYHVIYPSQAVDPQVAKVMQNWATVDSDYGEGTLWIDLELSQGQSPRVVSNKTWEMVRKLRDRMDGWKVGVYSAFWFLSSYAEPQEWWSQVDWWLANYLYPSAGKEHPGPPARPPQIPAERVIFHQTSEYIDALPMGAQGDGNVRIDGNRFLPSTPLSDYIMVAPNEEPPPIEEPIYQIRVPLHVGNFGIKVIKT